MYLKYRFDVGYKRLCTLVADSITWRRFCLIGLEASVRDESTIRKITRQCGPEADRRVEPPVVECCWRARSGRTQPGACRYGRGRGRHQISDPLRVVACSDYLFRGK